MFLIGHKILWTCNNTVQTLKLIRAIAASSVFEELAVSENPHLCATLIQYTLIIYICVSVYTCMPTYVSDLIGSLGKYCSLIFSSESI